MKRLIQQRYLLRQNLIAALGIGLSFYFCYHLVAGERSYLRLVSLNSQIAAADKDFEHSTAERAALEQRVVMMRPGSVNRDLLEEQSRKVLGYHYKDEKVLISNN